MSETNSQGPNDEFWEMTGNLTRNTFLKAVEGDEDTLKAVLLDFAQQFVPADEHQELAEMISRDWPRFSRLLGRFSVACPEQLEFSIELTEEAYQLYKNRFSK